MRGMQLVRPGSLAKSNVLSSVVRNTSCSRGWLRLLVQSIFAAVTVATFILILLMTFPKWPARPPINRQTRCSTNGCRIVCKDTPFFGEYEGDIIHAVAAVEENCQSIFLTLENPMFIANTMPVRWLSILGTNIHELTIMNGNLMHVPPDAFLSRYTATVRVLVFQNLMLRSWTAGSLVGLSSLRRLYFKDCIILNVPRDAIRAVDDTLQSLTIIRSEHWDPTNVTGTTIFLKLKSVDFSFNSFKDVLGPTSFTGLQMCQVLYLHSCGITSIGLGTFDNLHSIEMLFLQNNHLITIPPGLFRNIMAISYPKPRISLQGNMWHCNCLAEEIRQLTSKDMLLTDPVCYSPTYFKQKTFSELETYCSQNEISSSDNIVVNITERSTRWWDQLEDIYGFVYVTNQCYNGKETTTNSTLRMLSPVYEHSCPSNGFHSIGVLPAFAASTNNQVLPKKNWIKLTYFLRTHNYSMVEIGALEADNYGLVWYQSSCPNEVYCVSDVPAVFRIYNIDIRALYVFCPIVLSTGLVERENCVIYHDETFDYEDAYNKIHFLLYVGTGLVCLVFGALCVYALILKNPHLLKGSKRILFVKHKTVDALVLPPKVPLRNDLVNEPENLNKKKIFIVPSNPVIPSRFNRNISTRSSKSSTPSYISALQPTEDQLAEWRIRHHFNNDPSLTPTPSELSNLSWVSSDDCIYHSIDVDNYKTYESLK